MASLSENVVVVLGDETHAEALRISERYLIKQGWKFTPEQVAENARQMVEALKPKEVTKDGD